MKKIRLIGVYDYTVVLTYISLVITLVGISLVIEGSFRSAVFCLALSGLCDIMYWKLNASKTRTVPTIIIMGCRSRRLPLYFH